MSATSKPRTGIILGTLIACSCGGAEESTQQVEISAGSFWMGCNDLIDGSCEPDEQPQHWVELSAFAIDVYEVTAAAYAECVDAGGCTEPMPVLGECNYGVPERSQHPINCITRVQAVEYCAWAQPGGRLPTEAEWEMAARGACEREAEECRDTMATYPWGDTVASCEHAVMDDGGGPGCGTGTTWAVGSKPSGASSYGVHDMAGNVWEFTNDYYDPTYYTSSPSVDPTGPASGDLYVLRGGRFGGTAFQATSLRASNRDVVEAGFYFDGLGVRCASDL